jgi:hypothetical protein
VIAGRQSYSRNVARSAGVRSRPAAGVRSLAARPREPNAATSPRGPYRATRRCRRARKARGRLRRGRPSAEHDRAPGGGRRGRRSSPQSISARSGGRSAAIGRPAASRMSAAGAQS